MRREHSLEYESTIAMKAIASGQRHSEFGIAGIAMSHVSSAPSSAVVDGGLSAFVTQQGDFNFKIHPGKENDFWNHLLKQKLAGADFGILLQVLCDQGSQKIQKELLTGEQQHAEIKVLEDCLSRHTCLTERLPLLFMMSEMSWDGVDLAHSSLLKQLISHKYLGACAVAAEARKLLLEKWHIPLHSYQDKYALHAVTESSNKAISTCVP